MRGRERDPASGKPYGGRAGCLSPTVTVLALPGKGSEKQHNPRSTVSPRTMEFTPLTRRAIQGRAEPKQQRSACLEPQGEQASTSSRGGWRLHCLPAWNRRAQHGAWYTGGIQQLVGEAPLTYHGATLELTQRAWHFFAPGL